MDASGDGHMRAGEIWVPDCVADGLAVRALGGSGVGTVGGALFLGIDGCTHLDIVRVDLSASNMAERARSRLWRWRPDPPP
jgi:hypothetical protein